MKSYNKESVIHGWISELPFMQQALLMTAMRGPDGCPKVNSAKDIVRYIRGAVMKPAGNITGNEDSFMWIDYNQFGFYVGRFFDDTDGYPMHFLMHLIHAAQVIGYKHQNEIIRAHWFAFYEKACHAFHMTPETLESMNDRMKK